MPLCADVDRLARGLDIGLTHMYDEQRQVFEAPQVGSFFEVHREDDEHGVSLVGTARKASPRAITSSSRTTQLSGITIQIVRFWQLC